MFSVRRSCRVLPSNAGPEEENEGGHVSGVLGILSRAPKTSSRYMQAGEEKAKFKDAAHTTPDAFERRYRTLRDSGSTSIAWACTDYQESASSYSPVVENGVTEK